MGERTPVYTKGHTRRASVPAPSSGPNNQRRKTSTAHHHRRPSNLLLQVLSLQFLLNLDLAGLDGVREPGDGWWDQTCEVAGAVWEDRRDWNFEGLISSSACFYLPSETH